MSSGPTWPFRVPEGVPEEPDDVASDPRAHAEWCRITAVLSARRRLSPAWGGMIMLAATTFADLLRAAAAMETCGRTQELAASHDAVLASYRAACRDLQVDLHPSATVRAVTRV
jgi:hypothetical protein